MKGVGSYDKVVGTNSFENLISKSENRAQDVDIYCLYLT